MQERLLTFSASDADAFRLNLIAQAAFVFPQSSSDSWFGTWRCHLACGIVHVPLHGGTGRIPVAGLRHSMCRDWVTAQDESVVVLAGLLVTVASQVKGHELTRQWQQLARHVTAHRGRRRLRDRLRRCDASAVAILGVRSRRSICGRRLMVRMIVGDTSTGAAVRAVWLCGREMGGVHVHVRLRLTHGADGTLRGAVAFVGGMSDSVGFREGG